MTEESEVSPMNSNVVPKPPKHKAGGNVYERRGSWFARVSLGGSLRMSRLLATCETREDAEARALLIADFVSRLRAAGQGDMLKRIVEVAADADEAKLAELRIIVEGIIAGVEKARPKKPAPSAGVPTFADWREKWTDGELAKLYPNVVGTKRSANEDALRARKWIEPTVGPLPLTHVTLEHFEEVMRKIPSTSSDSTRRHVAQIMRRVLDLAVYPGKYITANPIPKTAMPRIRKRKLGRWLYPAEDAQLLRCEAVDLGRRLLWGFLLRLGWRKGEAIGGSLDAEGERHVPPLPWSAVDLRAGDRCWR